MSTQPHHTPRERLQEAKRALYRETILDAAELEFAAHGYEQAKVTDIAKGAGVSLATLYGTFPKKHDVYRALQKDRLERLMREVGTKVLAARDPFERLRGGIEGYLRFHMEHPDYLRGQLREGVPWGTTDQLRTPEQTQAWQAGRVMMMTAFEAGMDEGWFVRDDPELCARTATAMSQVRLSLWIDRDMDQSPGEVAKAAMLQLLRTFARPQRLAELTARL
ncbi:MAG: TetR/AcrR family transcriptional regulator [Nannocystaceae bacterium]|nr:TetR/AcrR family transcriptional regulator [Nannocystaceae bacterium]